MNKHLGRENLRGKIEINYQKSFKCPVGECCKTSLIVDFPLLRNENEYTFRYNTTNSILKIKEKGKYAERS